MGRQALAGGLGPPAGKPRAPGVASAMAEAMAAGQNNFPDFGWSAKCAGTFSAACQLRALHKRAP